MSTKTGDEIILYDIPSNDTPPKTWSLNPWKVRLVLNYKDIPYRTEWVEYPDLRPTLSKLVSARENPAHAQDEFTSPAITIPGSPPTHVMDAFAIAQHLETLHPSPPLHLDHPSLQKVNHLIVQIRNALVPIFMPLVCTTQLPPRSAAYFRETREARISRTLEDLYADADKGGANAFAKAGKDGTQELAGLYAETKAEGPFLLGKEPSYADFVVVGMMRMFERLGRLDEWIEAGGEDGKELRRCFEACRGWMERDDH